MGETNKTGKTNITGKTNQTIRTNKRANKDQMGKTSTCQNQ